MSEEINCVNVIKCNYFTNFITHNLTNLKFNKSAQALITTPHAILRKMFKVW